MWSQILLLATWTSLQFCTAYLPFNQVPISSARFPYNQVQISSARVPYNQVQWTPYIFGFQYVPPSWLTINKPKPQKCRKCARSSLDGYSSDSRLRFWFPQVLPCCKPVVNCDCGKTRTRIIGGTETTVSRENLVQLLKGGFSKK